MTDTDLYVRVVHEVASGAIDVDEAAGVLRAMYSEQIRAVDDTSETLQGLCSGIREFRGVASRSSTELAELLQQSRRRFAIHVRAVMDAGFVPEDTLGSSSTSMRRLQRELLELAEEVSSLVEATIRDSHARKDLEVAGAVQRLLIPEGRMRAGRTEVCAWYRPAEACSGDWWSFAPLGSSGQLLVVGDVTGHGAASAMIAAQAKGAMDMARVGMRDALKPHMALNILNHILCQSLQGEFLMTALVFRLDEDHRLHIANAGHRSPWIFNRESVTMLPSERSSPLGASTRTRYADQHHQLAVGDLIVAFTDGIPECENAEGEAFGERRLRAVCEEAAADGPDAVCAAVQRAVEAFVGDLQRLDDDVTLVALQLLA